MNIQEIDVGALIIAVDCAAKDAGSQCSKVGNRLEEHLKDHLWGGMLKNKKECTRGAA